jgi:hypothetical protein
MVPHCAVEACFVCHHIPNCCILGRRGASSKEVSYDTSITRVFEVV